MEIIFRRSVPNKFDQMPVGTLFHCPTVEGHPHDHTPFDIWVQTNQDDNDPVWKRAGTYNSLFDSLIEQDISALLQSRVAMRQDTA